MLTPVLERLTCNTRLLYPRLDIVERLIPKVGRCVRFTPLWFAIHLQRILPWAYCLDNSRFTTGMFCLGL